MFRALLLEKDDDTITAAVKAYGDEVRSGAFPTAEFAFTRKTPRTIAKIY